MAVPIDARGQAVAKQASDQPHVGDEAEADKIGAKDFEEITFKIPQWLDFIFTATGISGLQYRIQEERYKRADETYQNPHPEVLQVVQSMNFEAVVGCLIVLNCICIGWEASIPEGEGAGFFGAMEHIFVALFFVEWCLRIIAFSWVWCFEFANFCDTVLVFGTGVFLKWVLEPAGMDIDFLRIFSVLRVLRLARLARAVRLQPAFKELWILIHGLTTSARPLMWTLVIALMILYISAVGATELMKHDYYSDDAHVQERFGDLMKSMYTMFQLMTMDTWGEDIARPVMKHQFWLCVFFVIFVGLAVFVFWNLITAVIVENAFSIAQEDSAQAAQEVESSKRRDLRQLATLFLELDKDGSGELSREEFLAATKHKKVAQLLVNLEIPQNELEDVWRTLDDGDGLLTIKEFTNGIRRMKGPAKAKDIIDVTKRLRHTALKYTELRAQVDQFGNTMGRLESDVERIATDTGEVLGLFQEMYHRLSVHVEQGERDDKVRAKQRQKEEAARLALAEAGSENFDAGGAARNGTPGELGEDIDDMQ